MPARRRRVGLHVSAAGGVEKAPDRAAEVGAECFQFFSRSPRGGASPAVSYAQARKFQSKCARLGLESYIHTPYYINFASTEKRLSGAAPRIVSEEMEKASQLAVKYVTTHLGSAGGAGSSTANQALNRTVTGLKKIFEPDKKYGACLLLEIAAGSGRVIGSSFEELSYILKKLGRDDVHICLDTCHMFASGYDITTNKALDATMKQFRRYLAMSHLKLLHVNDSQQPLGSRKDRHEHVGRGEIGTEGFKALLAHQDFQKVNFILETKHDKLIREDLRLLKKWRDRSGA